MRYFASLNMACLLVTCLLAGGMTATAAATGLRTQPAPDFVPARGMFLVARRNLPDPNFRRTVVLLLRHGEDGSLGVVVNRLTHMLLAEVAPQLEGVDDTPHRVFLGGPVALDRMLVLMRHGQGLEPSEHVVDDLYFSADRRVLERLLSGARPDSELHVYAGHAGWAPGQLDYELTRGDWHLVPGDIETVFAGKATSLWETLIEHHEPSGILVRNGQQETGAPARRTMVPANQTSHSSRNRVVPAGSASDLI